MNEPRFLVIKREPGEHFSIGDPCILTKNGTIRKPRKDGEVPLGYIVRNPKRKRNLYVATTMGIYAY